MLQPTSTCRAPVVTAIITVADTAALVGSRSGAPGDGTARCRCVSNVEVSVKRRVTELSMVQRAGLRLLGD